MSAPRCILLVGEGNFSFSAALTSSETRITATCLQRHDDVITQHQGASAHIETIRKSGGVVLFEVDCTKLEDCVSLQGLMFDRVVFNFPHCGRKSGVKKNRELLKSFFLSCVQVLSEDGEVHVALCNGQGGTPADRPMREWHNSWQVVAMAAEADLVLTSVRPFESEKVESYRCTGYRSQDKGFHVEKGLIHVFTRGSPLITPVGVEVEEAVDGERVQYHIPAELRDYMLRDFLSSDSVHPVKLVQDFVLEALEDSWSISMTTEPLPFLLNSRQLACLGGEDVSCYVVRPLPPVSGEPRGTAGGRGQNAEEDGGLTVLRPSLLPQMEEMRTRAEEELMEELDGCRVDPRGEDEAASAAASAALMCGISGLVFRDVPVDLWALPALHQLLLRGLFPAQCHPITLLGQRLERLLSPHGVSMVTEPGCLRLTAQSMGLVGRVFASRRRDNERWVGINVSLNLDLLAVILFSLPDWRILWSRDPRFLKQFSLRPSPGRPYRPLSLFPLRLLFDVSFWAGRAWGDGRKLHGAVREACCGTAERVELIDTFSGPDPGRTSYCYRITYRSHSHALSHAKALQLHQRLEELLSSRLHVTIR